jgi:CubicO group peptidase (beta-lactamase class C family)
MDRLAVWMTGSFSSAEQAAADPETYTSVLFESCRIWPEQKDGVWLYLERAVSIDPDRPYQQLVAHITTQRKDICKIDTFDLPGDRLRYAGAWRSTTPLAELQPSDLTARRGCDIVVRSEADDLLVGETEGDDCQSTIGDASYATSSIMLSPDMLMWWDRGFSKRNEQVWGPAYGGYLFKRIDDRAVASAQTTAVAPNPPTPPVVTSYERAAQFAAKHGGTALVILEDGDIVFEQYESDHTKDHVYPLASGTVSFWGVLAAAASQDGLIDLDEPVSETISEWTVNDDKQDVTIRQLLNFTSGLDPGLRATTERQVPDRFQYAMSLDTIAEPGDQFGYGPSHLEVFGELLYRKLPDGLQMPQEYLQSRLLDPIGMRVARWHTDEAGNPYMFFGANLTAREWAKFGELIRQGGNWSGEPVIDAALLGQCLRGSEVRPDFGLGFWLGPTDAEGPEIPADIIRTTGSGQQRLYIIPSREMVAVHFGNDRDMPESEFLQILLADD